MDVFLIDTKGSFYPVEGEIGIRVADFIMRLQTLKGEQSFHADNGLGFEDIINGRSLLLIEVNNIAQDFTNYFDVEVKDAREDKENKVMSIDINMRIKNGSFNSEMLTYTALIGR